MACASARAAQPTPALRVGTTLLTVHTPFNVFTVAGSPNALALALDGADDNGQIRAATTGKLLFTLYGHQDHVWASALLKPVKHWATGSGFRKGGTRYDTSSA